MKLINRSISRLIALPVAMTTLAIAADRPANVTWSQWVREDIFAGFLANDTERFEQGMAKIDAGLAELKGGEGTKTLIGWRAGGEMYLAVRAFERGDRAGFDKLYAKAVASFAASKVPPLEGPTFAIEGGVYATFGERLPAELKKTAYERIEANYTALRQAQSQFFDKLSLHERGEVLSGLAQAAQRLGRAEVARQRMEEVIASLPGSPYERRAKLWLDRPELAATTSMMCLTCHDANRLANLTKTTK
jgi:hypothetical protein